MMIRKYPYNHSKLARIDIRTTNKNKAAIKEKAGVVNMFVSDFLVHAAMSLEIPEIPSQFSEDALVELAAIGNNLNQIARNNNILKKDLADIEDSQINILLDEQNQFLFEVAKELKELRGFL
jgi:hypothetical protein